jgi:hypothetical protein
MTTRSTWNLKYKQKWNNKLKQTTNFDDLMMQNWVSNSFSHSSKEWWHEEREKRKMKIVFIAFVLWLLEIWVLFGLQRWTLLLILTPLDTLTILSSTVCRWQKPQNEIQLHSSAKRWIEKYSNDSPHPQNLKYS